MSVEYMSGEDFLKGAEETTLVSEVFEALDAERPEVVPLCETPYGREAAGWSGILDEVL